MRALWLAAALAVLAGCQDTPASMAVSGDQGAVCERRLQDFDRAELFFSNGGWGREQFLSREVQRAAQDARQAGCVTGTGITDRLAAQLPAAKAMPRGEHGAPIQPIWLQAGIVGGISAELQSRDFFSALGFTVRSRGAPGLGRRVFIGPFSTEGGLADAAAIARSVGFVAPYPRRF